MATNLVSLDDFKQIFLRQLEIGNRLKRNQLNPSKVLDGLQAIINGRTAFVPRLTDFDDSYELLYRYAFCQHIGALFVGRLEPVFGWRRVQFRNGWNFFNRDRRRLASDHFAYLDYPQGDVARARLTEANDSWVFIRNDREILAPRDSNGVILPVDELHNFNDELALVKIAHTNPAYNFLKRDGTLLLQTNLFYAKDFSEGLAAAKLIPDFGSFCYINTSGQIAIKGPFVEAENFSDNFAAVKHANSWNYWSYINHQGNTLLTKGGYFESASSFHDGWAVVRTKADKLTNNVFYINNHDNRIIEGTNDWNCQDFQDGLAIINIYNGPSYIIDTTGQVLLESKYEIYRAENRRFWVRGYNGAHIDVLGLIFFPKAGIGHLCQITRDFSDIETFVGDWAKVSLRRSGETLVNYLNRQGEYFNDGWFIEDHNIDCHPGREGLAIDITNNYVNYLDRYGRTVFGYKQNPKT